MKITIGSKDYTQIENLKFDPSADITGTSVEINQFSASIKTSDTINFGDYAYLYDDKGTLWAKYWITTVEQVNDGFTDIVAQSLILLLERFTLPAKMYSSTPIATVLSDIFGSAPKAVYSLDSSFSSTTVTGYCKEQTARERLQWLVFTIGAYIQTCFTDEILIKPVTEGNTFIPQDKVFYRPTISYADFVTSVKVRAYSYKSGTPASTDEYVQVGDTYYIQTYQDFELKNQEVPETAATNVIEVNDCTLVNTDNADEILSRLGKYYFKRTQVRFDALDDGSYLPAQEVTVPLNTKTRAATGYISECSFSFGHAQKAQITLRQSDTITTVELIITYTGLDTTLGQKTYHFPAGYHYSVENPYFDTTIGDKRYVFYPDNEKAEGTMGDGATTDTESESVALTFERYGSLGKNQITIASVDELKEQEYEVEDDNGTIFKLNEVTIS